MRIVLIKSFPLQISVAIHNTAFIIVIVDIINVFRHKQLQRNQRLDCGKCIPEGLIVIIPNKNIHVIIIGDSTLKHAKNLRSIKDLGSRNSVEDIRFMIGPILNARGKVTLNLQFSLF